MCVQLSMCAKEFPCVECFRLHLLWFFGLYLLCAYFGSLGYIANKFDHRYSSLILLWKCCFGLWNLKMLLWDYIRWPSWWQSAWFIGLHEYQPCYGYRLRFWFYQIPMPYWTSQCLDRPGAWSFKRAFLPPRLAEDEMTMVVVNTQNWKCKYTGLWLPDWLIIASSPNMWGMGSSWYWLLVSCH